MHESPREFRFVIVQDHTNANFRNLISKHWEFGSFIVMDEWVGHHHLSEDGFENKAVSHSKWFVNPEHGAHTHTHKYTRD